MTKTPVENMAQLARLAGEMVEAIVEQDLQVLQLVQAEIKALGTISLIPVAAPDRRAAEAEIEAGFDNMPV